MRHTVPSFIVLKLVKRELSSEMQWNFSSSFFFVGEEKNEEADLSKMHDEHWKIDLWLRLIGFSRFISLGKWREREPQIKDYYYMEIIESAFDNVNSFKIAHLCKCIIIINEQSISKSEIFSLYFVSWKCNEYNFDPVKAYFVWETLPSDEHRALHQSEIEIFENWK